MFPGPFFTVKQAGIQITSETITIKLKIQTKGNIHMGKLTTKQDTDVDHNQ